VNKGSGSKMPHTSKCYLRINGGTEENQSQLIWPRYKRVSPRQKKKVSLLQHPYWILHNYVTTILNSTILSWEYLLWTQSIFWFIETHDISDAVSLCLHIKRED